MDVAAHRLGHPLEPLDERIGAVLDRAAAARAGGAAGRRARRSARGREWQIARLGEVDEGARDGEAGAGRRRRRQRRRRTDRRRLADLPDHLGRRARRPGERRARPRASRRNRPSLASVDADARRSSGRREHGRQLGSGGEQFQLLRLRRRARRAQIGAVGEQRSAASPSATDERPHLGDRDGQPGDVVEPQPAPAARAAGCVSTALTPRPGDAEQAPRAARG